MNTKKLFCLVLCVFFGAWGTAEARERPLNGYLIMLDPGHGGSDPGAVGPTGLKESTINLRVARYLRTLLQADGAKVLMTREDDSTLSLGERVAMANEAGPDLFVSIHHNASIRPTIENEAQVYYNALDRGIPAKLADHLKDEFIANPDVPKSVSIPGGFYVLRNNHAPAILTEAGIMSIPHIEMTMQTGRALTDEAQQIRLAIRKAFTGKPLRASLMARNPLDVSTPFFNLVFSATKPVAQVHVRFNPPLKTRFAMEELPTFGNQYILVNRDYIPSGEYEMALTFLGTDGSISPVTHLQLRVQHPPQNSVVLPVAPFIPRGFKGKFPLELILKDPFGELNPRAVPIEVHYADRTVGTMTEPSGKACIHLELDGTERRAIPITVVSEDRIIAETVVPISLNPQKSFILGRILEASSGAGLERVKVHYGAMQSTLTGPGGYFSLELPFIFRNLKLEIEPPLGYLGKTHWINTGGAPVYLPTLSVSPLAPGLLDRKIGIVAPRELDDTVRLLVRSLMAAGAQVRRFNLAETVERPMERAIVEANLEKDLDVLLSLKSDNVPILTLRHYYRGGRGQRLAEAVSAYLTEHEDQPQVRIQGSSEYEINHTGPTCLVLAMPRMMPPNIPVRAVEALTAALQQDF